MAISRRNFLVSGAIISSATLAMPAVTYARQPILPLNGELDLKQLDAVVDEAVFTHNTPGIAVSVWKNGKEIYSRTRGMANLETGTPVSDTTVFRIGSLTKQFVGALILKLVAEGKLSLSDPVHKHLPFLAKYEPFTILELLNHTAGVRDSDYDTTRLQSHSQIEQARRIAEQSRFFDFRPGTAWLYSNANYILIGAIIEQLTEKPLAEAAAIMLFKPLGLEHTAFDSPAEIVSGRASGYSITEKSDTPLKNAEYLDVSLAGAAGAMRSTASDLCKWHHMLFHDRILSNILTAQMALSGKLRNGQLASKNRFSDDDKPMGDTEYGLGLMLDHATKDKSLIANHHGGINGFSSYLASHVSSDLSFSCLCNCDTNPGLPFRNIRRKVFSNFILLPSI